MKDFAKVRIGLFGIGLAAYWEQFPGLRDRLTGYIDVVKQQLEGAQREIVTFGLVDSPECALAVGHEARIQDVDLLVLYVTTYALSSTVLPLVRRAKVPVLLLNLQPAAAMDYATFNALPSRIQMTGEWLAFCSGCPVSEIANVFSRCGIPFHQITGVLQDDIECWEQIEEWMQAAQVVHRLSHLRVGLMGHYYNGMLDVVTDLTAMGATFGLHFEIVEIDELTQRRLEVGKPQVDKEVESFRQSMQVMPDCDLMELEGAARTSVALREMVEAHQMGALAYFYKGRGVEQNEETITSIILGASVLTSHGIPVAGEYEVKNVVAMKILDAFGIGGSFTEYYTTDFTDDIILMGHDGPGHTGIAEGKTVVRSLPVYHGKVGRGVSIEMSVKTGPVTLLSIAECEQGRFKFVVAEGEAVPGPTLQIGNINSRYRFPCGARNFIQRWNQEAPAHHCAIGVGHISSKLEKLAQLLGIPMIQIC